MAIHSTAPLTVAGLVDTLGADLVRPLTPPATLDRVVSVPVIYDGYDEVPDAPGGVLLLVGLGPGDAAATEAIGAAPSRGIAAVAIKLRDAPGAALAEVADRHEVALLAVHDAVSWRQLDGLVAAVTSGSASGGDDGRDLFVLADAIATAVDGAVAIEDLDRNVLAYSNLARHTVDPLRRSGILARRVPDMDKNRRQYRDVLQSDRAVHFPYDTEDGELARCAVAVRAGREAVGSIWVIEHDHPLSTEAETSLLEAGRLVAVHILRMRSAVDVERQVRGEWLHSLLDGHGSAPVTAARFGLVPGVASVLVAFTFRPDGSRTVPLTRQLTTAVEQYCGIFRTSPSCVSIGQIVYVLLPAVRDEAQPGRLARGAVAAIAARLGHPVIGATSSPQHGLDRIVGLREEVEGVLDVLVADSGGSALVASARDVHAQLLLRRLGEQVGHDGRLWHPAVQALLAHDRRRGTAYRQTLCAYFAALGDIASAAERLRVHPNTVRYRVRRAQELFGLRLDGDDERLAAWLALRLADGPGPGYSP